MASPTSALWSKSTRSRAERLSRSPLEGTRILVVDNDLEFLELAATVLRDEGAEFRAVSSPALAHDLLETWLPNVVVAGPMLACVLRTSFVGQQLAVPIVALTAAGTRESCALFSRAEFDLYLTKPVDPVELTRAVGSVVRRGA